MPLNAQSSLCQSNCEISRVFGPRAGCNVGESRGLHLASPGRPSAGILAIPSSLISLPCAACSLRRFVRRRMLLNASKAAIHLVLIDRAGDSGLSHGEAVQVCQSKTLIQQCCKIILQIG
jgi:hypothetical protein